jgi:tRNA (guanine37-N1)-methyltransferase
MRIDIITVLPELLEGFVRNSILARATKANLAEINLINLREYGMGNNRQVDDYPYGGGAGMVMRIEPVFNCIEGLQKERHYDEVIYTAPDGELLDQPMANKLSLSKNLIILCGHYKGIDERIREHLVTKEISIGDYVLTGGELAAAVITDAVVRLLPGVLGDEESALSDSFQDQLVAPPIYTRPPEFKGWKVPDVLMNGNFKAIDEWRFEQAVDRTADRRPRLYQAFLKQQEE